MKAFMITTLVALLLAGCTGEPPAEPGSAGGSLSSSAPEAAPARGTQPASAPESAPAEGTQPASWPEPAPAVLGGRSTDGNVARKDLDARIAGITQAVARGARMKGMRATLVDALLARTGYFGTYSDFDRALALADEEVALAPTSPEALTLRARVLSALHRFDEAVAIVESLAADHAPAAKALQAVKLARGEDLAKILAERRALADKHPSYGSWTGVAVVEARLGNFEAADKAYREAIEVYRDVSPMAFAWVAFQRGVMWAERAGQRARAFLLYQEAVKRLPGYVVAQVHLAELESSFGLEAEAIARLSPIKTENPEPAGLLSELVSSSDPSRSAALVKEARDQYNSLLGSHRLAFADHGSEFFAGPGDDPALGLKLAKENLANRATERARLVAIRASLAADDSEGACALAKGAPAKPVSVPLAEIVASACP